jgi:hypothetical protein
MIVSITVQAEFHRPSQSGVIPDYIHYSGGGSHASDFNLLGIAVLRATFRAWVSSWGRASVLGQHLTACIAGVHLTSVCNSAAGTAVAGTLLLISLCHSMPRAIIHRPPSVQILCTDRPAEHQALFIFRTGVDDLRGFRVYGQIRS